ncbi:Peptidase propeptide and YPEB domain-containing protein [Devosia enhydra]|uniref:Peptidase propeptide and YPEB domain-containing protein n=1 Tax=Devosia enhydra TaxID=665118 RepID=A0A1K2I364_9HYPH|nr:PepSY domain-containing protein [Devosia enhydra]SFZ86830.1 Peptidase propeptide and YPEB domain-containing protein [Devosia enhydra]
MTKKTFISAALIAALVLPAGIAIAQPAAPVPPAATRPAFDADAARALLEGFGLTDIRLDDDDDGHFEFDARTAEGYQVEIEIGRDGEIRKIDLDDDDDDRGSASLIAALPAGVREALSTRGVVALRDYERKPRHFEIEGVTGEGREIEIELRNDNRVGAVSVSDPRGAQQPAFDEAAFTAAVVAAGYQVSSVSQRPRHVEVDAVNPEGEPVRLHADFDGTVYKETLVRGAGGRS